MSQSKTREQLMLELQQQLESTQNLSIANEIAMPGVNTPVHLEDLEK